MNYSKIEQTSVANGEGVRVALFVSGCRLNCPGCFNKVAQSFKAGQEFTQEPIDNILESIDNEYVSGLSILGGEPFDVLNIPDVWELVIQFRSKFGNSKTLWMWTGYLVEDLRARGCEKTTDILLLTDVLVDGPFVEDLKDPSLAWRGSSNQRVIQLRNETI